MDLNMVQLCVITWAPDVEDNYCDDFEWTAKEECKGNVSYNVRDKQIEVKKRVFYPGEVFLVNDYEREIGYPGRKPSKWGIGYRLYPLDQIAEALKLAEMLSGNDDGLLEDAPPGWGDAE